MGVFLAVGSVTFPILWSLLFFKEMFWLIRRFCFALLLFLKIWILELSYRSSFIRKNKKNPTVQNFFQQGISFKEQNTNITDYHANSTHSTWTSWNYLPKTLAAHTSSASLTRSKRQITLNFEARMLYPKKLTSLYSIPYPY